MLIAAGILLLVAGVASPVAGVLWLNRRLSRKPSPRPRLIALALALNGVLPVGLVLGGFLALSANMREMLSLRMALVLIALVAIGLAGVVWWELRRQRSEEGRDERDGSRAGI
jgi:hypothetical protein